MDGRRRTWGNGERQIFCVCHYMGDLGLREYVNMKGERPLGWVEGGGQQLAGTTGDNSWDASKEQGHVIHTVS